MADSEAKSGGSKKYTPISYSVEPPISENLKNLEKKIEISTKITKTAEKIKIWASRIYVEGKEIRFLAYMFFFLKNFRKIFFRPKRLEMVQNVPKKIFRKIFFVLPLGP